jgi:hypothetical protein
MFCNEVARILSTRTAHDVSKILLEVLKADIGYRLQTLAFGVQDEDQHHMLKPGEIWWVSSLGDNWCQQYPEAQHICEQLGFTTLDMGADFGKRWTANSAAPFNLFRTRKLGNVNFISVELINEFSDYGSDSLASHYHETNGAHNSVANKKTQSTDLGRLERQVRTCLNLTRLGFIEQANKNYDCETISKEPTKELSTSPARILSPDAPPTAVPISAPEVTPFLEANIQSEMPLPEILSYVKNLRNDKEKCEQEDVRKELSHIAYELMTILKDYDDRVFLCLIELTGRLGERR